MYPPEQCSSPHGVDGLSSPISWCTSGLRRASLRARHDDRRVLKMVVGGPGRHSLHFGTPVVADITLVAVWEPYLLSPRRHGSRRGLAKRDDLCTRSSDVRRDLTFAAWTLSASFQPFGRRSSKLTLASAGRHPMVRSDEASCFIIWRPSSRPMLPGTETTRLHGI